MSQVGRVIVGLLVVAVAVTSVGWLRSAASNSVDRTSNSFESCRWEAQTLVLSYTYGANQRISVSLDSRDGDLVASLHQEAGGGITPAIALSGESRFTVFGGKATVRDTNGNALACGSG